MAKENGGRKVNGSPLAPADMALGRDLSFAVTTRSSATFAARLRGAGRRGAYQTEVFLRAAQNVQHLRTPPPPRRFGCARSWRRCGRTSCVAAGRRSARRGWFRSRAEKEAATRRSERLPAFGSGRGRDPLEEAAQLEYLSRVRSCLRELPALMRRCLVMFALQERRYQEIADLLQVSIARVKSDIYQARRHLLTCVGRKAAAREERG